jgi:hypothetical protein
MPVCQASLSNEPDETNEDMLETGSIRSFDSYDRQSWIHQVIMNQKTMLTPLHAAKYQVTRLLGYGGHGFVIEAQHPEQRQVDIEFHNRFLSER